MKILSSASALTFAGFFSRTMMSAVTQATQQLGVSKTVLITGSSRGIGLGLVKEFLQDQQTRVIATCRTPNSVLQELSSEVGGDRLIVLPLETTSAADYETVKTALRALSVNSIDILIANAGISSKNHPVDPVLSCTEEDMMDVFRTNCVGTMLTMQAFAPMLIQSNIRLCIVLSSRLASIEQAEGLGGYTSYRASKAAVNMLAMTFAEDPAIKAAKVKTLCMHPGWVQTDMGGSGGRKAPVSVEDCTRGIVRMIGRASAYQLSSCVSAVDGGNSNSAVTSSSSDEGLEFEFESALAKHSCVFTAFDGEMLPW